MLTVAPAATASHRPSTRRDVLKAAAVVAALLGTRFTEGTGAGASGARNVLASDANASAGSLRSVAAWLQPFDATRASARRQAVIQSASSDSSQHYSLSYTVDALTAAYRASGVPQYALDAMSLVENVARSAVPSSELAGSEFHDDYLAWASLTGEDRGNEIPLYESYFWRYATTLLRVMLAPSSTLDGAARARARPLVAFAEQDVFDKWRERGAEDYIFRGRTHMAAHWALICLNLMALTEDPTSRAVYAGVVEVIDNGLPGKDVSLRRQFVANPRFAGALFWSDRWGERSRPGQDVSHGNGVVAFVVEAHDSGLDWSDHDIEGLVRTLEAVIWPPGRPPAAYVDGSGVGTGWFSDGFVKLGRYDLTLQRRLERHVPANSQFFANGALNARWLGAPMA